jgi:hypothetical protein
MLRPRSLLITVAATAVLAGGGAAVASAATSTSTTPAKPAQSATTPGQGTHAPPGRGASGSHNCPNM